MPFNISIIASYAYPSGKCAYISPFCQIKFLRLADMHNCMIFSRFEWGKSVLTDPVMSSGESV